MHAYHFSFRCMLKAYLFVQMICLMDYLNLVASCVYSVNVFLCLSVQILLHLAQHKAAPAEIRRELCPGTLHCVPDCVIDCATSCMTVLAELLARYDFCLGTNFAASCATLTDTGVAILLWTLYFIAVVHYPEGFESK